MIAADTANDGKTFLSPRLLSPTRLWFRWLSVAFNKGGDFVEMNIDPATTPICGWVVSNHLDISLMLYDADGKAIGSLGLRYGAQRYRTRPANIQANPSSDLSKDIGQPGNPIVNPNLANFMGYVYNQSADLHFLFELMAAIETAGQYINPANHPQDAGLSVFIGRPLALTRAVLGLETSGNHPQADPRAVTGQETSGNLLPLNQVDGLPADPFPIDVHDRRYAYKDRQKFSSGNLGAVQLLAPGRADPDGRRPSSLSGRKPGRLPGQHHLQGPQKQAGLSPKFEAEPSARTRAVAPGKINAPLGGRRIFFATQRNFFDFSDTSAPAIREYLGEGARVIRISTPRTAPPTGPF